ncbi:MAG: HIT domain-containing protein [candidate division WOR-3 bacterium]
MKKIWAPWRMEYIKHATKSQDCIFCKREQFVLKETDLAFVMLNLFPYNPGHLMVAPKRHEKELEKLTNEEILEIFTLIKESIVALKKEGAPDGFNIGVNIGRVAGAGFEDHIHFHVVPRWNGDTNFMPVVGEVRVIPEGIQKTYERLIKYFKEGD